MLIAGMCCACRLPHELPGPISLTAPHSARGSSPCASPMSFCQQKIHLPLSFVRACLYFAGLEHLIPLHSLDTSVEHSLSTHLDLDESPLSSQNHLFSTHRTLANVDHYLSGNDCIN